MSTGEIWHVPYQRNRFFTGRDDELNHLHRALLAEHTVALSHPQGISGLGGIGKTQTALEYAYRYQSDYSAVFWVNASSLTALTSDLVQLANVLDLPERQARDEAMIVEAVLRWFRLHTGWLLIYDNIDDLSIADHLLPKAGPGHILFTTRAHAFGEIAQRVAIQQMEPDIGALLLLRRAEIIAPEALLEWARSDEQQMARLISQEVDGLPLALDQAGAYIKETPCLLSEYLPLYRTRRSTILQERGHSIQVIQDYPASVATTWSLSFGRVQQANPAAAELLNACAFLAPNAIPEELLISGASHLGDVLAPVVRDPIQLDQVCKDALRYSLLQRRDDETLVVHRLVQAVLQDNLPSPIQADWKQRVVLAVNMASPDVRDIKQWSACERWVPHALVGATWIDQEQMSRPEATGLLNRAGYYLLDRARYREAEPLHVQALKIVEKQLGAMHPDTATGLNNLAALYRAQGRYEEAEPLFMRALAICEAQLGAMHPDTASSLNNLAALYEHQGKYEKAEPLYQRALSIREQQLGETHPDTAMSQSNLASLYRSQGRYKEAEPLFLQSLTIREQQLGVMHLDTASSLSNLAVLYEYQGKYEEAEPLFLRALAIREQQLGTMHPDTATSLNNLAEHYRNQRKYEEAEPFYQRALEIAEEQLGAVHPNTAACLSNLAILYTSQGRYEEAEPLFVRALEIAEEQLGAMHPDTATYLINLAALYERQGKYEEAEPVHQRALEIRERQLGATHPSTANSLSNLATIYRHQGRYEEAEPVYLRALAIREQQLGATHPDVAMSLSNLAALYRSQERYEEAEPAYLRALEIREQQLGATHPDTATTLNNLADLYRNQGRYEEAEPLFVRALAIYEQQLGATHLNTINCMNNLAVLYEGQGRYEEAEPLYLQAVQCSFASLGIEHSQSQQLLRNYLALCLNMYTEEDLEALLGLLTLSEPDNTTGEEAR